MIEHVDLVIIYVTLMLAVSAIIAAVITGGVGLLRYLFQIDPAKGGEARLLRRTFRWSFGVVSLILVPYGVVVSLLFLIPV